jgi:hypothetical protein
VKTNRDLESRLRRIAWPEPADELRARVLAESAHVGPGVTWIDRIWFSRAWRQSVLVAAAAIILVGQWLAATPQPAPLPAQVATARTESLIDLINQAGVPADLAAAIVRREVPPARSTLSSSNVIADFFPVEGAHQ